MLCQEVYFPFNKPDWYAEDKEDGDNFTIRITTDKVIITNRRLVDISYRYPELLKPELYLSNGVKQLCLSAEGVVYNSEGKSDISDFHRISQRSHLQDRPRIRMLSKHFPTTAKVYDIREFNNRDLTINCQFKPLKYRKALLSKIIQENDRIKLVKCYANPIKAFLRNKQLGKEGVIMKDKESLYDFTRSESWLKVKNWNFSKIEYSGYEVNKRGITLEQGIITEISKDWGNTWIKLDTVKTGKFRAGCNGSQSHYVRERIDRDKSIKTIIRHLATHHNPQALREPSFWGVLESKSKPEAVFKPLVIPEEVKLQDSRLKTQDLKP